MGSNEISHRWNKGLWQPGVFSISSGAILRSFVAGRLVSLVRRHGVKLQRISVIASIQQRAGTVSTRSFSGHSFSSHLNFDILLVPKGLLVPSTCAEALGVLVHGCIRLKHPKEDIPTFLRALYVSNKNKTHMRHCSVLGVAFWQPKSSCGSMKRISCFKKAFNTD